METKNQQCEIHEQRRLGAAGGSGRGGGEEVGVILRRPPQFVSRVELLFLLQSLQARL
jgi:hypothetical protein